VSHSLQLLAVLVLVISAAKLSGALAIRFGQPAVLGEIVAGLVLGPSVLNMLGWPMFTNPSSSDVLLPLMQDFADLGVVLLMFVAGLETDLDQLRQVGRTAFLSAAGGVVLPLVGGIAIAPAFGLPVRWTGVFIGTILTATSVSISAQTLMELGVLKSREGSTILGAAVMDDVMGIVILSLVVAFARSAHGSGLADVALLAARMCLFFAAALLAGSQVERVASWGDRLGVSQSLLATVLVVAFVFAWTAEFVGGIAAISGAYMAGVFFGRTRFKARIDAGIHPLTYSVLVPVFFITIGLRANVRTLHAQAVFAIVLVAIAVIAKVIGCGGVARWCGFSRREAIRVGVGMISRGEVGLIVAGYGLGHGVIRQDVFSASVVVVIATTVLTPPLLRAAFGRGTAHAPAALEEAIAHVPENLESSAASP
jgi:Kef-type K+ transport system membrane component KefB